MIFLSNDKKTINLPVALDTTVYRFVTSCNDACLHQKEKFNKIFKPKEEGRCHCNMPCHTKLHSIQPVTLSLSNLERVLSEWNITIFKDQREAMEKAKKLIESHKQELLRLGLEIE